MNNVPALKTDDLILHAKPVFQEKGKGISRFV